MLVTLFDRVNGDKKYSRFKKVAGSLPAQKQNSKNEGVNTGCGKCLINPLASSFYLAASCV